MESIMNKINPLEVVQEQYHYLKEKLRSTHDVREMKVIVKRLINLLGVMEFLISVSKNT
jgi:ubiquinone biosynthesis protein Coq4